MRLIDADKLKEEIGECPENWLDSPEEIQAVSDWKSVMDLIDAAPTIDAIPVKKFCEWLKECRCNIFKEAFVINAQLFRADMEKGE